MIQKYFLLLVFAFLATVTLCSYAQNAVKNPPAAIDPDELGKLRAAVEASPDSLKRHQDFIKAVGIGDSRLEDQYKAWMKQFPSSATVPFALGEAYYNKELPTAKPYLLKALELDPKLAKAYFYLWIDAERWGDFAGGRAYLAKAKEADPSSPDYAFYFASSHHNIDPEKYRVLSLEVAKRFPESERGAQALYWLGYRSTDKKEKLKYFELLHKSYSPEKFNWSSSGMSGYFDLLLEVEPEKALALAKSLAPLNWKNKEAATWQNQINLADTIVRAKAMLAKGNSKEAAAMLSRANVSRWSTAKESLMILKAAADAAAGNTSAAYDSLAVYFAKEPTDRIKEAMNLYSNKLDKNAPQVNADIWKIRDNLSKEATPFTLKRYFTTGSSSLSDYRGKVVLITYWFPGCGPCRGEFPHFENVVKKFKGQDLEYLGINIVSDQNDYVIPFMKTSGYSFTPLEDYPDRKKGNLDNRGAAPVNFLIDKEGKVVFSNFRTSEANERTLELMISSLLDKNKL